MLGVRPPQLLKDLALDAAAELGWRTGATRPERCHAERLTVLTFHRVLPEAERARYPYPGLAVTPDELDVCLRYVSTHYDVGPMTRQLQRFETGAHQGRPLLALTFDDGQWDNLAHAVPLLERHGLPATFYIPVDAVEHAQPIWHDQLGYAVLALAERPEVVRQTFAAHGLTLTAASAHDAAQLAKVLQVPTRQALVTELERRAGSVCPTWGRLMTWPEVRSLHERGHEVGSHSLSHELMPQLGDAQLEREVTYSKVRLEDVIGAEVLSFCYPNGDADWRCKRAVAHARYHNAVTTLWGTNGRNADRHGLMRCDVDARRHRSVSGRASYKRLALRISGLQPNL
jgi:peptidoglycan/xylan/chitin deacetylase (PgdA/CDA1 family)